MVRACLPVGRGEEPVMKDCLESGMNEENTNVFKRLVRFLLKHFICQLSFGDSGYRPNHDYAEALIYGNSDFPTRHMNSNL
jgi:hypothetical protein